MSQQVHEKYEQSHLYKIRHSAAHIMAQAVLEMFPEGKFTIGPPIEHGFYYDFDLPRNLAPEDLEQIEKRMRQIIQGKHEFRKRVVSAEEAKRIFTDQPYKLELIEGLEKGGVDEYGNPLEEKPEILIYQHDAFVDLCRGPHVENTREIKPDAFKLMNVAGAYWRGDEKNKMLQRIYGTAWENADDLKQYLWKLEEAKQRDHRKLGRELGLFILSEEVGLGLPLWLPKGATVRKILEDFIYDEQVRRGYHHVYSPHIGKKQLWITSGHWDLYQEKMYSPMDIDGVEYLVKPMNCPMHMMMYKSQIHSYKELPIRIAENATVYRREQSGELTGLLRVRGFTQDDAHIFARPDQVKGEFLAVLDQTMFQFKCLGFNDFEMWLSVRDPLNKDKYLGSDEVWAEAESAIEEALKEQGLAFIRAEGEAKFYGPALDIQIKDALGRKWQCTTIQVDFMLPMRFELEYIDADSRPKQPVVLHRAPFGSMERFIAILIEHYAGAFPVWLAPVQAIVIPIADRHLEYAREVTRKLRDEGLRVELDERSERMNAKIRDAQRQKVPYMLVLGDNEMNSGQVSLRVRDGSQQNNILLRDFMARATDRIARRASEL
jgi:threonyl-tRNA synthetase